MFIRRRGKHTNREKVSVILAARNEEKNIRNILTDLAGQNYPQDLYEVIVANDFSDDRTADIVRDFAQKHSCIKLLNMDSIPPNFSPKKFAIQSAVELAKGDIILATDAANAQNILRESFGDEVDDLFFPRTLSNAVVRLWFDKIPQRQAEAGIFSGDFMLHNYFWLDRIYNPFRRWGRETGGSVIEAHIYGPPDVLDQPEGAILAQAVVDTLQAWPELRGHLVGQHLQIKLRLRRG